MKFGVSLWLWTAPVTNEVIEDYAPKIAELGFDTVEVPLEDPTELDCYRARKAVEDSGLSLTTCAAMGGGRDLIHPEKSVRDDGMKYMKESLDAAEKLGSELFVGPLASEVGRLWESDDVQREKETQLLVSQLREVADYAASKDIIICLEALNRFETSFLNLTNQVCDVVDRVNHPNCKVMIDLFHAGIEEKNLGDAIRSAGDNLYHFQVAENDRGTPGTGQFDWEGIAKALKEIGYDRHIIIETFTQDNELLAKAAAIWRPLAESPDQLARDGLSFLKKLLK
ncbi:MAG: sugar phosphate isomerase/epimerase family protein [Balneolaceae bacterium]|nr:sugar phosphate isomerase/epimerase family protein [Balneolaceae bacterium]MDR9410047.1 sugar phosphate isomerase/epimerase family protein [Balneolaceae bacterium]